MEADIPLKRWWFGFSDHVDVEGVINGNYTNFQIFATFIQPTLFVPSSTVRILPLANRRRIKPLQSGPVDARSRRSVTRIP